MSVVAHDEAQSLKERIFAAAITVFAEHGLSGARIEQIATEAQTTKRMVVYYFKTKELLYQAVLQHVYARIRETEQQLGLENVPPVEACHSRPIFSSSVIWLSRSSTRAQSSLARRPPVEST